MLFANEVEMVKTNLEKIYLEIYFRQKTTTKTFQLKENYEEITLSQDDIN